MVGGVRSTREKGGGEQGALTSMFLNACVHKLQNEVYLSRGKATEESMFCVCTSNVMTSIRATLPNLL